MNIPENLHYSIEHEWVRLEGDSAIIGITDFAQNELGDIIYVETPPDEYASLFTAEEYKISIGKE